MIYVIIKTSLKVTSENEVCNKPVITLHSLGAQKLDLMNIQSDNSNYAKY